eukprot:jgi/Bigna1/138798/aug1.46_g13506
MVQCDHNEEGFSGSQTRIEERKAVILDEARTQGVLTYFNMTFLSRNLQVGPAHGAYIYGPERDSETKTEGSIPMGMNLKRQPKKQEPRKGSIRVKRKKSRFQSPNSRRVSGDSNLGSSYGDSSRSSRTSHAGAHRTSRGSDLGLIKNYHRRRSSSIDSRKNSTGLKLTIDTPHRPNDMLMRNITMTEDLECGTTPEISPMNKDSNDGSGKQRRSFDFKKVVDTRVAMKLLNEQSILTQNTEAYVEGCVKEKRAQKSKQGQQGKYGTRQAWRSHQRFTEADSD